MRLTKKIKFEIIDLKTTDPKLNGTQVTYSIKYCLIPIVVSIKIKQLITIFHSRKQLRYRILFPASGL
jgi:hypothetical protein